MFTFEHKGEKYEVKFRYPEKQCAITCFDQIKREYHNIHLFTEEYKPGRFVVEVQMYLLTGVMLDLPHETRGSVRVPEKALRGQQTYIVPTGEHAVSRVQARERALSALLRRKGFSRSERLYVFAEYYMAIADARAKSAATKAKAHAGAGN